MYQGVFCGLICEMYWLTKQAWIKVSNTMLAFAHHDHSIFHDNVYMMKLLSVDCSVW